MPYSNFTLEAAQKTFQLEMVQSIGIFSETEQVNPSSELSKALAKKDDLITGLGQCVAEMIAAQRFNAEKRNDIPCIYGAITTGINWLFLKLAEKRLHIDMETYMLERCDKILGILASMVSQKA